MDPLSGIMVYFDIKRSCRSYAADLHGRMLDLKINRANLMSEKNDPEHLSKYNVLSGKIADVDREIDKVYREINSYPLFKQNPISFQILTDRKGFVHIKPVTSREGGFIEKYVYFPKGLDPDRPFKVIDSSAPPSDSQAIRFVYVKHSMEQNENNFYTFVHYKEE